MSRQADMAEEAVDEGEFGPHPIQKLEVRSLTFPFFHSSDPCL